MANADQIRVHAREKYVSTARQRKQKQFSINVGDVVRELKMVGRVPAVCSALWGEKFLVSNSLRRLHASGPPSGQSTTVTYTYEFVEVGRSPAEDGDYWKDLRGALKNVFAALGGGEAYLRAERSAFHSPKEGE